MLITGITAGRHQEALMLLQQPRADRFIELGTSPLLPADQ